MASMARTTASLVSGSSSWILWTTVRLSSTTRPGSGANAHLRNRVQIGAWRALSGSKFVEKRQGEAAQSCSATRYIEIQALFAVGLQPGLHPCVATENVQEVPRRL